MLTKTSVVLSLIVLVAPSALASWGSMGSVEPDTQRDVADGWNAFAPDASRTGRTVYFNGFQGQWPGTAANPNLATLGTSNTVVVSKNFALLGVWKDCNRDGFVGWGDQGVIEYRAEALLLPGASGIPGASVCPVVSTPDPIPDDWFPSFNDGTWVREFLSIQWRNWEEDADRFDINDNGSRVWADSGLPGVDLSGTGGSGCWINPQPRGTYHSTGGVLQWLDCHTGWQATNAINGAAEATGVSAISFADHPRDQRDSASVLNQKNPWGEEDDAAYASVWSCGDAPLAEQHVERRDVASGVSTPGANATVYRPGASGVSPDGSPSGTANATASGLHAEVTPASGVTRAGVEGECERGSGEDGGPGAAAANAAYANEGDVVNEVSAKTSTEPFAQIGLGRATTFSSSQGVWDFLVGGDMPPELRALDPHIKTAVGGTVGLGAPADLGVRQSGIVANGLWFGTPNYVGPNSPGSYWTYYARVSPAAVQAYGLTLPKGAATGTYAAEACPGGIGAGQPVQRGWACDPTKWFRDGSGADIEPRTTVLSEAGTPYGARPGSPYNLRDVDCYDNTARVQREQGLLAGPCV